MRKIACESIDWRLVRIIAVAVAVIVAFPIPSVRAQTPRSGTRPPADSEIPNRPDLVTVVPFELYRGFILVQAQIDDLHGTFLLDTGSPVVFLNENYVKATIDGVDTVKAKWEIKEDAVSSNVTIHQLKIGTFVHHLPATGIGPPEPYASNAQLGLGDRFSATFDRPILGTLGLDAMESFETIVDYAHRRLILIRLDSAGHRKIAVPAFTATAVVPLLPIYDEEKTERQWWGVRAHLGNALDDTLMIDTGDYDDGMIRATHDRLANHLRPTSSDHYNNGPRVLLDRIVVGEHTCDTLPFTMFQSVSGKDVLGYSFLSRFDAVGFNLRTRQFIFYH